MTVDMEEVSKARADIEKLIKEKSCGPLLIRLAWHDAGTFEEALGMEDWPKCGGANGSIQFDPEITHAANGGLNTALALLEPMHEKYKKVGFADLVQIASAQAILSMGGPKIPLRLGRTDASGPDHCHPEGNLPAGAAPWPTGGDAAGHLRAVFHRMGLTDKDIVLLSGAHTVGRAHASRSGLNHMPETKYTTKSACPMGTGAPGGSSWTPEWTKFDNSYYKLVRDQPDPELLALETDTVLFKDEKFKPYAEQYAESQDDFFKDYAESHKKLSELGVKWDGEPVPMEW